MFGIGMWIWAVENLRSSHHASVVQGARKKNCNKLQHFSTAPPCWPKPISTAYFHTSYLVDLNRILARIFIQYRHPVLNLEASALVVQYSSFFGRLDSLGSNDALLASQCNMNYWPKSEDGVRGLRPVIYVTLTSSWQ